MIPWWQAIKQFFSCRMSLFILKLIYLLPHITIIIIVDNLALKEWWKQMIASMHHIYIKTNKFTVYCMPYGMRKTVGWNPFLSSLNSLKLTKLTSKMSFLHFVIQCILPSLFSPIWLFERLNMMFSTAWKDGNENNPTRNYFYDSGDHDSTTCCGQIETSH